MHSSDVISGGSRSALPSSGASELSGSASRLFCSKASAILPLDRKVSLHASDGSCPPNLSQANTTSSPQPGPYGESHETLQSEAKNWFEHSNQHPAGAFDSNVMDDEVDPPFFQKESDSSVGENLYPNHQSTAQKLEQRTHSSSADDYRSVIDDLTVEIQNLKEELKRYRQSGPETMRRDKLFEIKVHGLPRRKKRELETTLRDFAARLGESPTESTSQRQKTPSQTTLHHTYSGSRSKSVALSMSMSMSKHASSSSGSNNRPADSAYASISTGAPLNRPHASSRHRSSDRKVQNYLRDIPEGLYPRHVAMTEKEKKKLVVRRLEQIFTGKLSGHHVRCSQTTCEPVPAVSPRAPASVSTAGLASLLAVVHDPTSVPAVASAEIKASSQPNEPSREAQILPVEHQGGRVGRGTVSHDITPATNSNEDRNDFAANGKASGNVGDTGNGIGAMGSHSSQTVQVPPEQRPTRLKDLDPDRVQNPSENMEYIRHLGIVPPELACPSSVDLSQDVEADKDGWVYLNLLCNMAQLHIMNVTPDFVRAAVTEFSTKFQLSHGGHKIRWRGGTEGTRFSSDSSGGNSQRSPGTDGTEGSKDRSRKRRKIGWLANHDEGQSLASGNKLPAGKTQTCPSMSGVHYQPLFVRTSSTNDDVPMEDDPVPSSPSARQRRGSVSGWNRNGATVTASRRKRRHDGVIIYYSGAPFCTDLSGDMGDLSPSSSSSSIGQGRVRAPARYLGSPSMPSNSKPEWESKTPKLCGPLGENSRDSQTNPKARMAEQSCQFAGSGDDLLGTLLRDEGSETEIDLDVRWSTAQQSVEVKPLEPCGLGGVVPDDHFMVVVTTERPRHDAKPATARGEGARRARLSAEATEAFAARLAPMCDSSCGPAPASLCSHRSGKPAGIEIRYVMDCFKRLAPEALPPPTAFFPPLSEDSWSEEEVASSRENGGHQAHPYESDDEPDEVQLR